MYYEQELGASLEHKKQILKNRVMQYVDDITNGNIRACKKTIWGVKRFLNDLDRTDEFYLDWNEVLRINEWASMFKHTKGVLSGQPIVLTDMQLYLCANILGFKRVETGYRRYRQAYMQFARKNAKTQLLAIIASYVAYNSHEIEEVYIAGWTKEQSKICYNEILNQLKRSVFKEGVHYTKSYGVLTMLNNDSVIKPLSKEAKNFGDGTNPSVNIIDEYGTAHKTNEIVDVQISGMVGRNQPLTLYITTPGFDLTMPCFEFYQMCSNIVNPEHATKNDDIFVAIYEIEKDDDITDEANWVKSNPIVASYPEGIRSLRADLKVAMEQPTKMRNFLTKGMGMWVDMVEDGYISLNKWNKQIMSEKDANDFIKGSNFYIGVDLSSTVDLTSVATVFVKEGKYLVTQTSFTPEDMYSERMSQNKTVRFDLYRDRGELIVTEGAIVDYEEVYQYILHLMDKYTSMGANFQEVCFDKWQATMMMTQLEANGVKVVEVPQAITHLSEPTKRFREELFIGNLYHLDDHLFQWSITNAITVEDASENIKLAKNKANAKNVRIDPVAASITAFARAMGDTFVYDLESKLLSGEYGF